MTTDHVEPTTDTGETPRRRDGLRWIFVAVGVVVLAVGAVAAVSYDHWLTHPDALLPAVNIITESGPITVGRTYAVDTSLATRQGPNGAITLDRVEPIVSKNTAAAAIRMELCRHRPAASSVGDEPLSQTSRECLSVVLVAHQTVILSEIDTQLIAVVTPTRPGTIQIDGYHVAYHQGRRHQTQSGGIRVHWTAKSLA
jgi:hypothetical protein